MAEKGLTGYPSIDKPWLKYYSEKVINANLPECTVYEYLWVQNKDYLTDVALVFCDKEITYGELFERIDAIAKSFLALGIHPGDIVSVCIPNIPEAIYIFYALNRISCICNFLILGASETVMHEHLNLVDSKLIVTIAECYDIFRNFKKCDVTNRILVLNITETFEPLKRSEKFAYEDLVWQEFLALSDSVSILIDNDGSVAPVLQDIALQRRKLLRTQRREQFFHFRQDDRHPLRAAVLGLCVLQSTIPFSLIF